MELENFRITKNEKLQKSQNFINLNFSDKSLKTTKFQQKTSKDHPKSTKFDEKS